MSGELFTSDGERKYLTASERQAFLLQAEKGSRELRTFCAVLVHTGCRISEALALTPEHIDISSGVIVDESIQLIVCDPATVPACFLIFHLKVLKKEKKGSLELFQFLQA